MELHYKFHDVYFDYDVEDEEVVYRLITDEIGEEISHEAVKKIIEMAGISPENFAQRNKGLATDSFREDAECDFRQEYFECAICGEWVPNEDRSEYDEDICVNCCEDTQEDNSYWDAVNEAVDRALGERYEREFND